MLLMKLNLRACFAAFVFVACGFAAAQPAARSVAPASGKSLCSALTPADFTRAGVPVLALSQANLDGPEGAYCVYKSSAGKVEFDLFFPAGANANEIKATEKTVLGEGGGKYSPVQIAGADAAQITLSLADQPANACIVVRSRRAVFDIMIPGGAKARQQLLGLAQTVLSRLKQ